MSDNLVPKPTFSQDELRVIQLLSGQRRARPATALKKMFPMLAPIKLAQLEKILAGLVEKKVLVQKDDGYQLRPEILRLIVNSKDHQEESGAL